ncbi:MAG: universal stress protein [Chitinophagales bacterium]
MITILIPTDYSKNATNAIRYALQLTKKIPCKFIFLHGEVIPLTPTPEASLVAIEMDTELSRKELERYALNLFSELKMKIIPKQVSYMVTQAFTTSHQILEAISKSKTDLVIMGARGASNMKKILFGSTTADVIAGATVPVITVPESYRYAPLNFFLHASDLKNLRIELGLTLPLAMLFNATLEVAHITDGTVSDAKLIAQAQSIIKSRSYKKLKLYVEAVTFGQTIAKDIKLLSARHHPDMLVMFRHKHNWLGRLFFTSMTENLMYETKVPLVSFNVS